MIRPLLHCAQAPRSPGEPLDAERVTKSMRGQKATTEPLPSTARENLELLERLDHRTESGISGVQRAIERISAFFGSPAYFIFAVAFILVWVALNAWGAHAGWRHVDAPPFPWLQGLLSSNALLVTVAVLIRQNRMAQMAEHRSHLDLQINLLAEQKASKILELIDELHRELKITHGVPAEQPSTQMDEMTKPTDPHAILDAIKEKKG
jgi:uncharacterized membrane protein